MNVKELLKICEEKGKPVSKSAIYFAGLKYGFISKANGEERYWTVDMGKFNEWVEKRKVVPEQGFVPISKLSQLFSCSISKAYKVAKKCNTVRYGAGSGVLYVNLNNFESVINGNRGKKDEGK